MKHLILSFGILFLVFSCDKSQKADVLNTETESKTTDSVVESTTKDSIEKDAAISSNAPVVAPASNTVQSQVVTPSPSKIVPANPSPSTEVKTAPGMNPPHGKPGHRCDIPVGAPLNTPPQKTPANAASPSLLPQTVSTPAPAPVPAPSAQKTVTAPGMNPPHGEAGHRCDIPVGAPLSSK